MISKLFCFGMGYTGIYLGRRLRSRGWSIAGTCTTEKKRKALLAEGFDVHIFLSGEVVPDLKESLSGVTHVVASVPPDNEGDPVIQNFTEQLATIDNLSWAAYLSSTGVYGDHGGNWVNEGTRLLSRNSYGIRRKVAEDQWLTLHKKYGVPSHIFRLAGIYGPCRSSLDLVRAGKARRIIKDGLEFSRVHVDDVVGSLLASIGDVSPGKIYNVADDEPAPSHEVVSYACRLLEVAPPPITTFEDAVLSARQMLFFSENKKVDNKLLKDKLKYVFKYANYREGLRGLLESYELSQKI